MSLTVRALTTIPAVATLAEEWQQLHDLSEDVNPFTGPVWSLAWLEHFAEGGPGREPYVLEVREDAQLVAVVPMYRESRFRGTATVIQPIGTGQPWIGPFELPGMAALPGEGRDAARAVVAFLGEQTSPWDWSTLSFGNAVSWLEPEWLPDWSYTVLAQHVRAAPILDLTAENIYTGRRNLKESFRRARNRLTRDFGADGWSVRRVVDPAEVGAAFSRLADLHGQRSQLDNGQPIHADVLHEPAVRVYLDDVIGRLSQRGQVSFYELLVGDEVLASQLILHTASASYSSISGAAERIWPYSAVTYLQSQAVADAQASGQIQMCLSIGPTQAKMRWTSRIDVFTEFALVGSRRKSRALYLGSAVKDTFGGYLAERRAHRV